MKKLSRFFIIVFLVLLGIDLYSSGLGVVRYQGILREGGVLVNGRKKVKVRVTDEAGIEEYYCKEVEVECRGGYFVCDIDLSSSGIDLRKKEYYLEVSVEGNLLLPREKIVGVVYSLRSMESEYSLRSGSASYADVAGSVYGNIAAIGDVNVNYNKIVNVSDIRVSSVYVLGGRVGIGTNDPLADLHIVGVILTTNVFELLTTSGVLSNPTITQFAADASFPPPPITTEPLPLAILYRPFITEEDSPLAVLEYPPRTEEYHSLAVLYHPPRTEEYHPRATFPYPLKTPE